MRRLRGFDYREPTSLEEALFFLTEFGKDSAVLAGGTDLLVGLRQGNPVPKYLVNIKKVPELEMLQIDSKGALLLGASTRISQIEFHEEIRRKWGLLGKAAHSIGSPHVRNLATIGGNLCNASPAADTAPVLIALGAEAELARVNGRRIVSLQDFFLNAGQTCLSKDELLTKIIVPEPSSNMVGTYLKLGVRKAMEIGIVSVALCLSFKDGDSQCNGARIVLGSVAPTPIRAWKAESVLKDVPLDINVFEEASELAAQEAEPITDVRATAAFRKEMVGVVVKRALKEVLSQTEINRKAFV